MTIDTTYRIRYRCTNCDYTHSVEFRKGTVKSSTETCPNCGCHTSKPLEGWGANRG